MPSHIKKTYSSIISKLLTYSVININNQMNT